MTFRLDCAPGCSARVSNSSVDISSSKPTSPLLHAGFLTPLVVIYHRHHRCIPTTLVFDHSLVHKVTPLTTRRPCAQCFLPSSGSPLSRLSMLLVPKNGGHSPYTSKYHRPPRLDSFVCLENRHACRSAKYTNMLNLTMCSTALCRGISISVRACSGPALWRWFRCLSWETRRGYIHSVVLCSSSRVYTLGAI